MPRLSKRTSVLLLVIGLVSLMAVLFIPADMQPWTMTPERQWWDFVIVMLSFTVLLFLVWEGAAYLSRKRKLTFPILILGSILLEVAVLLSKDPRDDTPFPYGFPYIAGPADLMVLMVVSILSVLLLVTLVIEMSLSLAFDGKVPRRVFGSATLLSFLLLVWLSYSGPMDMSIASPIPIVLLWETMLADGSSLGVFESRRGFPAAPFVLSIVATMLIPFIIWAVHPIWVS
jgi:hypothetical protein